MFRPKIDRIEYGGAMIGQEEKDAINEVIDSQGGRRWTIGKESVAFERELAEVTGVKRAVVVNSGSSALLIALASLKLPKGANVIIPAVNFPTAFNAIIQNMEQAKENGDLVYSEKAKEPTRELGNFDEFGQHF